MKNLHNFFLLVFIFIFFTCYSQNYKVIYKITYKTDSTENKKREKKMLLKLNSKSSEFYSYEFYQKDSAYIENIKHGKEAYQPVFDSNFSVFKDKSIVSRFYNFTPNPNIYRLDEIKNNLNWKILNEIKIINKYTCQRAQLQYKGRKWNAWFTKEIPLSFGPYVFDGLPGAILYIEDSGKNYAFELISLTNYELLNKTAFLNTLHSIKISKKQFIKINTDYYNDPYKEMRNNGSLIENSSGELGIPNINLITKEKQKFIKKNNNPIELSEAIKYP